MTETARTKLSIGTNSVHSKSKRKCRRDGENILKGGNEF